MTPPEAAQMRARSGGSEGYEPCLANQSEEGAELRARQRNVGSSFRIGHVLPGGFDQGGSHLKAQSRVSPGYGDRIRFRRLALLAGNVQPGIPGRNQHPNAVRNEISKSIPQIDDSVGKLIRLHARARQRHPKMGRVKNPHDRPRDNIRRRRRVANKNLRSTRVNLPIHLAVRRSNPRYRPKLLVRRMKILSFVCFCSTAVFRFAIRKSAASRVHTRRDRNQ